MDFFHPAGYQPANLSFNRKIKFIKINEVKVLPYNLLPSYHYLKIFISMQLILTCLWTSNLNSVSTSLQKGATISSSIKLSMFPLRTSHGEGEFEERCLACTYTFAESCKERTVYKSESAFLLENTSVKKTLSCVK